MSTPFQELARSWREQPKKNIYPFLWLFMLCVVFGFFATVIRDEDRAGALVNDILTSADTADIAWLLGFLMFVAGLQMLIRGERVDDTINWSLEPVRGVFFSYGAVACGAVFGYAVALELFVKTSQGPAIVKELLRIAPVYAGICLFWLVAFDLAVAYVRALVRS